MVAAATSLFRDWELLQDRLIPPLLHLGSSRRPSAWTVGTAADAVALTLAYRHARRNSAGPEIRVFLSSRGARPAPVSFGLADIRCVPRHQRSEDLVCRDRRWVPDRLVTEKIILADPHQPVDLVTIRHHPGALGCAAKAAIDGLRRGGHLLFVEPPPADLVLGAKFKPAGPGGRLYKKLAPARIERSPGAGDVCDAPTLAAKQVQALLVESHYSLAKSLARRFAHHGELSDDLEQVALLALVKAAGRYSPDRGSSFATFATASILGELKRHFRDKTWMLRVPRSLQETYLAVKVARDELGQTLGTSPTVQHIAAHLGISDEAVLAAMEAGDSYWPASLDTPRKEDEDSVTEVPVIDGGFDKSLDRRQLRESLPRLDRREQVIVKRLYFDGWTQRRVAEEIGVSQMQVSRLMARMLGKLRVAFEEG